MKLPAIILLVASLQLSVRSQAQKVTLSETNATLEKVFAQIRKQTGFQFLYNEALLAKAGTVSLSVKNVDLETALKACFARQPLLTWSIVGQNIVVKEKPPAPPAPAEKAPPIPPPLITIQGRITDEAGEPVQATVMEKGTGNGTVSNASGNFTLYGVQEKTTLLISGVSIEPQEIKVNSRTIINITARIKAREEDEVVVAYNRISSRSNVGAVTVIKGSDVQSLPNRSFDRSLQGLVPGLLITKGTGQPGAGLSNMVLRGISTGSDVAYGSTARNPLIVIDGVPVSQDNFQKDVSQNSTAFTNPMAQLNPTDIETISVLKDAVAIALYGSKASNGVILVTTKSGKQGKTVYSFQHQVDLAYRLKGQIEMLDQQEYLGLLYETYRNSNPAMTDQAILTDLKSKFPTRPDGSFYPAADWHDALFTEGAPTIANNLSMSGGNGKTNFYLNLEYTKQDGIIKKSGYERTSMRLNFDLRPSTWLKLSLYSTLSYNVQDYTNQSAEGTLSFSPLLPVRLHDGNFPLVFTAGANSFAMANPAAVAEYNLNRNITYHGLNKLSAEIRLLKSLTLSSAVGVDMMFLDSKEKYDPRFAAVAPPRISERNGRRTGLINTNMLRFNQTIRTDHALNLTIGQEAQVNNDKSLSVSATGTAQTLPYYDQLNSPGYTKGEMFPLSTKQTLLSLFGQVNYGYRNKYFLSSSIRKDASSKFGDQQQWGTFWSAGAGWLVTAEKFMKQLPWLNYLKLRGSIGVAGNSGAVGAESRFDRIFIARYVNKDAVVPIGLGNPDIRWEQTFNWDIGLELKLLQEKISITADLYEKRTKDLIYSTTLPSLAGYNLVSANIGDMNNKGIELSIAASLIKNKSFSWNLSGHWSTNQNILVKANVPLEGLSDGILGNEEGRNFNSFYMPVWAGVNSANGVPQWMDKTGKPTSSYSFAKKEFVGRPQPAGFGALTNSFGYKGFNLSVQLYFIYDAMIYDYSQGFTLLTDGMSPYLNQVKQAINYWKKPGDIAANPRRTSNNSDLGYLPSTRYLFNSGYLRLQNVMLAYNFPKRITDLLHISTLRMFVQGNNLAIITEFSGPDPDNVDVGGTTTLGYPNSRTFSFGLNLNF